VALDVPGLEDLELRRGRRVLVRLDLNVPLEGGVVQDDLRIAAALPTLDHLRERGAIVVACSHLGRPGGVVDPAYSLAPVASRLAELIGPIVELAPAVFGPRVEPVVASAEPGMIVLLENLRFERGETENDPAFGTNLSMLGEAYVNDAFGASHRAHASIVAPPRVLPHAGGRLLFREVEALGRLLHEPARPFVAVLGGAKVSDKLGVIAALLDRCDRVLVGGAMAFTFLRARGLGVGASLVEPDFVAECARLLDTGRVEIPVDIVVAEGPSPTAASRVVGADAIPDGWMGLDVGPETAERYSVAVGGAATVLWNGPMGMFEIEAFAAGTERVARAVAESAAFTVVGGGDSAAAIRKFNLADRVDHLSTGGGASLELIEHGDLPGLEALRLP
jgi:phosphoglycerate kinase